MKLLLGLNHFIHCHLLKLLLLAYGAAILFPGVGTAMKGVSLGEFHWSSTHINLSLPLVMLSFLLLNAGLSVRIQELRKVFSVPLPLALGLGANILVPLIFTAICAGIGKLFWHNPDEVQNALVGLAIIASMPIAGSATAWVQNSNGNPALILGLVVFSTVLSPLFSPLVFHSVGLITTGDYSEDLHELASQGASSFLIASVAIPALAGIGIRTLISEKTWKTISIHFKTLALIDLLLLNYSNASISLPIAIKNWDPDFLAMLVIIAGVLCAVTFSMGWFIPKALKVPEPERVALTYGLGMSNNGTGLVLASTALTDHPLVMLPIIFYNLGQQLIAGALSSTLNRVDNSKVKPNHH